MAGTTTPFTVLSPPAPAAATEAAVSSNGDEGEAAAAGAGGDKTVNGVVVPALLLDRSKRARERLSAA